MDLQQLRVFQTAAQFAGFTRASVVLDLSQSTVSQHIRELENELGCSLFLRAGKKVYLSEAGRVLKTYADRIFAELKNAELSIRELSEIKRGIVTLGVGATTLIYRLPRALGEYTRRYPQIELIIVDGTTERLLEMVSSQAIDLAIVMGTHKVSGNLCLTPLQSEELVVILNARHDLASKSILDPTDLLALRLILYGKHTIMQSTIEAYFCSMDIQPKVSMEVENIEAIKSLVSAGIGASIVPACCVNKIEQRSMIRVLRVRGHHMERPLSLVTLNTDLLPGAIEKLSAQIIRVLATHGTAI
jgi:DNA-binding transcriptional LysR family regulator